MKLKLSLTYTKLNATQADVDSLSASSEAAWEFLIDNIEATLHLEVDDKPFTFDEDRLEHDAYDELVAEADADAELND